MTPAARLASMQSTGNAATWQAETDSPPSLLLLRTRGSTTATRRHDQILPIATNTAATPAPHPRLYGVPTQREGNLTRAKGEASSVARPARLLLVEDSAADARLIAEIITETDTGWTLTHVTTVAAATALLSTQHFDCVLLDLAVPDADGLEGVAALTALDPTRPIVVLTHRSGDRIAEQALAAGAQDYLAKRGLQADTLSRSVRYAIERKTAEIRLLDQSLHDPLTGLPNRALFDDRLTVALGERHRPLAVMFIDLDDFKLINDSLGHHAGDEVLRATAHRLVAAVRAGDTVARFAGDEFTVLCPQLTSVAEATILAERIREALAQPVHLSGRDHMITASVGLAISATLEDHPATLLSQADAALYRAKALGKNRCAPFDDSLRVAAMSRLTLTRQLHTAVQAEQFRVVYQPEIDLASGAVHCMEALVRWAHPTRGLLAPDAFLALAESSGLILDIGSWVLRTACAQHVARDPRAAAAGRGLPTLAVNISAVQLAHPELPDIVADTLGMTGLHPRLLQLEITETVALDHAGLTDTLQQLLDLGVSFAIDDFGTGYSSLTYLKTFPAAAVKIDRSFTTGLGSDPTDDAIVAAIITVAHACAMTVVAEGVETTAQRDQLRAMGCDLAQGYLYGRPS